MAGRTENRRGEYGVLRPHVVDFLQAHFLWLGFLLWAGARALIYSYLGDKGEIPFLFKSAVSFVGGSTPWVQGGFEFGYPPLALILSAIPALFSSNIEAYTVWFVSEVLAFDLLNLFLLYAIGVKGADGGPERGISFAGIYLFVSTLALDALLNGLHLPIVFCMLLLMKTLLSDRPHRALRVGIVVALGLAMHAVFIFMLPFLLLYFWRVGDKSEGYGFLKGLIPTLLLCYGPFFYISGFSVLGFFLQQMPQGLHIESLYTGFIMIFDRLMGHQGEIREFYGPLYLTTPIAKHLVMPLILAVILFWGVLTHYLLNMVVRVKQQVPESLVAALACLFLSVGFFSPWWSQHQVLWALPMILFFALVKKGEANKFLILLCSSLGVSTLFRIFYFEEFLRIDFWPVFMLIFRNVAVFLLIMLLAAENIPSLKEKLRPMEGLLSQAATPAALLVIPCLILWTIAANFTAVTSNDYWYHSKIGQDIWESMTPIYHDVYSAILGGKEFIAHEWLSGVVFYLVGNSYEGAFLTLLRIMVALMITVIIIRTIPRKSRSHLIFYPLLFLSLYQINLRIHVRPHMFSLLFIAALNYALATYHSHKSLKRMLWLVPMQVLWVNMHGSYLFSIAFLGVYAFAWLTLILFPRISSQDSQGIDRGDVRNLFLLMGILIVACLVNPYGYKIFGFSLSLFSGHDYFKQYIFEWLSPFAAGSGNYWYFIWKLYMVLSWGVLLLNIKRRPFLDFVVLAIMTYMTLSAHRYIALATVIMFPILLRQTAALMDRWMQPQALKTRPVWNLLIVGFVLGSTVNYGYPYRQDERRKLKVGLDLDRIPMDAISFLRKSGLEGTIFNQYGDGSYIIHYLHPKIRPVMDARVDLYGEQRYLEYTESFQSNRRFKEYLEKYQVNIIMIWKRKALTWAYELLGEDPNWKLAFVGKSHLVYVQTGDKKKS